MITSFPASTSKALVIVMTIVSLTSLHWPLPVVVANIVTVPAVVSALDGV